MSNRVYPQPYVTKSVTFVDYRYPTTNQHVVSDAILPPLMLCKLLDKSLHNPDHEQHEHQNHRWMLNIENYRCPAH